MNSCFQSLLQYFFAGISAGQKFLYLLQIPPESGGFLRNLEDFSGFLFPSKAVWLGQGTNSPPTSSPTSKLTCSPKRSEASQALPSSPKCSQALQAAARPQSVIGRQRGSRAEVIAQQQQ